MRGYGSNEVRWGGGGGLDKGRSEGGGGGSKSKKRRNALHTMNLSPQQFRLIAYLENNKAESSKITAQRHNAPRVLPVHPVFEDKNSNGSDEKLII